MQEPLVELCPLVTVESLSDSDRMLLLQFEEQPTYLVDNRKDPPRFSGPKDPLTGLSEDLILHPVRSPLPSLSRPGLDPISDLS